MKLHSLCVVNITNRPYGTISIIEPGNDVCSASEFTIELDEPTMQQLISTVIPVAKREIQRRNNQPNHLLLEEPALLLPAPEDINVKSEETYDPDCPF